MFPDKIFKNALIVSIVCHIILFYNWPALKNLAVLKPIPNIELTYYNVKTPAPLSGVVAEKEKIRTHPNPLKREGSPAASRKKLSAKPLRDLNSSDKLHVKIKDIKDDNLITHISPEKNMLISHKDKDYSGEPAYLNYYNGIRSRIYKAANANKPYFFLEGQVRTIFTLSRHGKLLNCAIIPEGSSTNPILRNHALMSIKRAAPFSSFLASMEEDRLTLRLTISFEK